MSSDSEIEFSDDQLTWDQVKRVKMTFGKYKKKPLAAVIKTSDGRDKLRFYMKTDTSGFQLDDKQRREFEVALAYYDDKKTARKRKIEIPAAEPTKKKKKKDAWSPYVQNS